MGLWGKLTAADRKKSFSQYVTNEMVPYAQMVRARAAHSNPRFTLICFPGAGVPEIGRTVERIVQMNSWSVVTGVAPIHIGAYVTGNDC